MSTKRDLSAFAAPVGLPAPPKPPAPNRAPTSAPSTERNSTPKRASSTPKKPKKPKTTTARSGRRRVCVSLTATTHDALRVIADERDAWKVEVILDGLDHWAPKLKAEKKLVERGRRRRSRRGTNPTPFVMDLTIDELTRLDDLTARCATSRSAMVRRLIELEATRSTATPT